MKQKHFDGNRFPARFVRIKKNGTDSRPAEGRGTATSKKIDLVLIQEGDIMVGSIVAEANGVPGRLSGKLNLMGLAQNEDIGCKEN